MATGETDRTAMRVSAGPRLPVIAESFERLAGRRLVEAAGSLELAMWHAPRVILAHGIEPDPLLFYANRAALELFEMRADALIGLPSHRTVEPALRGQRAALFETLERDHIVRGYSGTRVTASGQRFTIVDADVWNLVDAQGTRHGQAASFAEWRFL